MTTTLICGSRSHPRCLWRIPTLCHWNYARKFNNMRLPSTLLYSTFRNTPDTFYRQLTHPLVSPIVQGSLGNLPPLYIIAGDGEVLRDEIIHLAHRAAHPAEYPTRVGVLRNGNRQKANAAQFTTPTKVHLQVFDGKCSLDSICSWLTDI